MTQTAMIRGLARWAGKNMAKQFTAGGVTRIGFGALTRLAEANPPMAMQMALVKYPSLAPLVSTIKDATAFDAAWTALTESIVDNGCLTVNIPEPFPVCKVQTFKINRADLDEMRAEMERAYKDELAAAKAIEQAGNGAAPAEGAAK